MHFFTTHSLYCPPLLMPKENKPRILKSMERDISPDGLAIQLSSEKDVRGMSDLLTN